MCTRNPAHRFTPGDGAGPSALHAVVHTAGGPKHVLTRHRTSQPLTFPGERLCARGEVERTRGVDHELARRLELRPLDYAALNHVMGGHDLLGPAELSGRLGISTGSATELVDRLEKVGHLQRRSHPSDRRRKVLEPTDAALTRTLSALQPLFERLDELVEAFTDEEQAVIERYLRAVTGHFLDFAHDPPAQGDPAPDTRKDTTP